MNSHMVRPAYTVTLPILRPAETSDAVSMRPPGSVPNVDRATGGCWPPRTSHPAPAPGLRARAAAPDPFHEPDLETEWRLDGGHDLEQRVGCQRELLHLGVAAWACLDVGEGLGALSSCRDPERELRDLVGVGTAFGSGTHVVVAHRWLPSLVIVSRSFVRPARIRVFAVPRGIASL